MCNLSEHFENPYSWERNVLAQSNGGDIAGGRGPSVKGATILHVKFYIHILFFIANPSVSTDYRLGLTVPIKYVLYDEEIMV
jgi:hypothetical protein